MTSPAPLSAAAVTELTANLFAAAGLSDAAARRVAEALVEADQSGRGSHGVLQADGYLARLIHGSMSTAEKPVTVSESGGAVVLDAAGMQGHLAAEESMAIAVAKARETGVAAVAVRNGYHFGVAGRYVRQAAEHGCVAFAMCNTKPVMAAPGGAEALVGTNPLAIALPVAGESPIVLDMATTEGTVGRIRQALAAGKPIPETWALDENGNPTTDPAAALKNLLLLPMGGAKGFGLSLMIDLVSGLLASGGWGSRLGEMRGDLNKPLNASYLFIALDIAHFRPFKGFLDDAREAARRVREARKAPGTERLYTPGERSAETLAGAGDRVTLAPAVIATLKARCEELGVPVPAFLG